MKRRYLGEVETIWSGDAYQYRFSEKDIRLLQKIQENINKGWTLKAAAQRAAEYFNKHKRT